MRLSRRSLLSWAAAGALTPAFAGTSVTVRDSLGEHTFAAHPKRPVVLQWDILENIVGLGITPVGAADIEPWSAWVVDPALPSGIVSVGTRAEPNLERIAALKPDVILAGPTQTDLLPALQAVAPVLMFENWRKDASENEAETAFRQLNEQARLFGREERAREIREETEKAFARLKEKIEAHFGFLPEVQVIRLSSLTTCFLYTENSITDFAVRALGLRQAIVKPAENYGLVQVRLRELKHLTDTCVIYARPFALETKLMQSVLWRALPFTRRGRAAAAAPYWSHGGALSVRVTAERITEALLTMPGRKS